MKTKLTSIRGKKLKELRENKGYSLREVAEKASKYMDDDTNISYGSIKRYEDGTACDLDILMAICKALDYDPIKLITETMQTKVK